MNVCKAMADSTTPKPTRVDLSSLAAALPATLSLKHFKPALPFAVALSGGADSTALLLACAALWPTQVKAVHIHHGLQSAADLFASHCERLCEQLQVPIITTIIGEGGSGGALAISVADQLLMLQYSIYSVISPEGCASILWKTSDRASDAADALGITAHRLKALGLVDKIVNEPVGGAHRDTKLMASHLKRGLNDAWRQLSDLKPKELLERRYERLQSYGRFNDTKADAR